MPSTTQEFVTAFARFMSECWQLWLHLIRKQACVKVFNLILILSQLMEPVSAPRKQNYVLTRKHRHHEQEDPQQPKQSPIDSKPATSRPPDTSLPEQPPSSFILSMQAQIDRKDQQIKSLKSTVAKIEKILKEKQLQLQSKGNLTVLWKEVAELEKHLEQERSKNKQLSSQIEWKDSYIRQQLNQVQRLNKILNEQTNLIKDITALHSPENTLMQSKPPLKTQQTDLSATIQLAQNQDADLVTQKTISANKQIDNAQNYLQVPPIWLQKQQTPQDRKRSSDQNTLLASDSTRLHQQIDLDKKDRALKILGLKCIKLEAHIEMLTRKLVGKKTEQEPQSRRQQVRISMGLQGKAVRQSVVAIWDPIQVPSLHRD